MKLLIADDSVVTRRMLETTLTRSGYEVRTTADGLDAFNILESGSGPLLAILDVRMPGMEGTEICRNLRERDLSPPPYIILLTANSNKADMVAGLEAGADDYIIKPFDRAELLARVRVGERIVGLQTNLASHIQILEETSESLQQSSRTLSEVNDNLVTEISERKRAEDAMIVKTLELQSLVNAMTQFVGKGDWRETCQMLLEGALRLTNSEFAVFWGEGDRPFLVVDRDQAGSNNAGSESSAEVPDRQEYFVQLKRRLQTESPLLCGSAPVPDLHSICRSDVDVQNFLGIAIVGEGGIVGGIGVGNRREDYSTVQIDELNVVA